MDRENKRDWYPRLVEWKNWEVPVPGREAIVGFFVVLAACLALHFFVIWMCWWFKTGLNHRLSLLAAALLPFTVVVPVCRAQQPDEIRILKTSNGVRVGVLGATENQSAERRPTVFVFATSLEDTLGREPYNVTCKILRQSGFLCASLDLPAHGADRRPDEPPDLKGWRQRTEQGEPWLEEFKREPPRRSISSLSEDTPTQVRWQLTALLVVGLQPCNGPRRIGASAA